MSLFSKIDQMITDFKVADISKERIKFLTDQLTTLTPQIKISEDKNFTLQKSLVESGTEIKRLNQEVIRLNNIITGQDTHNEIEEIAEKILKQMFESDQSFFADQLTLSLGLKPGEIQYHFDALLEKKLIQIKTMAKPISKLVNAHRRKKLPDQPTTYSITPDGRKYIMNA